MGFRWRTSNIAGVRPSTAIGTSVTPAQNAFGSWVEVLSGATVARDVFGLLINLHSGSANATARDILADIGVDPAGGSSYTVLVPNLLCSQSPSNALSGVWYYFPIWIRAGSSIAVRGSVNNATVGTFRAVLTVFGSPTDRTEIRVGTYVVAYGTTPASSSGTAITSGTTSEGAWTPLATTTRPHWWWQLGMGVSNTTLTSISYNLDLGIGDASNKYVVITDQGYATDTSERMASAGMLHDCLFDAPSGVNTYMRMQASFTPDTGLSVACYGLGG